jgi:hypothetical protein
MKTERQLHGQVGILLHLVVVVAPIILNSATAAEPAQNTVDAKISGGATGEMTFGQDVGFLKQHVDTVVLHDVRQQAQIVVVPAYQGRVMTSTANGADGTSFGWINYSHIASGKIAPHINVYGGEERFWIGPEGGQYGIFFAPGSEFKFADWATPAAIDTEPFELIKQSDRAVSFRKTTKLQNYSKNEFSIRIERTVELLSEATVAESLGVASAQLRFIGYRTTNRMTNIGSNDWDEKGGLLSIWLLGMYKPGPQTTVVIPYRAGSVEELGPVVNDAYFGKVPNDRIQIDDRVLFFSGDGKCRSKIGVSPRRSTNVCGSYDAKRGVLTIVKYNKPAKNITQYVNSMWEYQDAPYVGDAVNAYNDGPSESGADPLGPFHELETSSPAFALKSGQSGIHIQETFHFEGAREQLDRLSRSVFEVSLQQINGALE